MSQPSITIETLREYSALDAAAIGRLMPMLTPTSASDPIAEDLLCTIIDSPDHDQLVARDPSGQIVGTATLSITMGVGAGRKAYLEDFVVDTSVQGAGIGSKLWDAMYDWCRHHGATSLNFTSNPSRTAAQEFYRRHGAMQRDTNTFTVPISD